ncbi:hypothetical protein JKY72_03225 [Candidatus Gracilibacteria bacterium]|nr:hypothetical protein [Candidatus Gracilibacteria bacterium]
METKSCTTCKHDFTVTDSDKEFYKEMSVPVPNKCGQCRQIDRLIWRNERVLYKRKSDATGKDILSVYHQDSPFIVYEAKYWHSDEWNALDYGQDYDFERPFFDQFKELLYKVPQLALSVTSNQNCDFVNQCGWCKNCYLVFEAVDNQNCLYSNNIYDSRFSMDCLTVTNCELCYECIDCEDSYGLKFSQNSKNCSESWFLKSCIGCKNCFGCINLRNKEYYFLNQKYSKEEYEKKIDELNLTTSKALEQARKNFLDFTKKFPQKYIQGTQNEDSTGDYIYNTQRCEECYDCNNMQDCQHVYNCRFMKKCYDITVFGSVKGAEFCYHSHEIGDGVRNVRFSDQIWIASYDISYAKLCIQNSHHLFGCVSLKHKSYCILNKQYSEDEYKALIPKIIEHMKSTGEWGQFFPKELSPYAYNETVTHIYHPLSKEEAIKKGYTWRDPDAKEYLPASGDILACSQCKKNYKIQDQEQKLYDRHNLPIPHKCHDCRHSARFKLRNPRKLHDRNCNKCQTAFKTTLTIDRPEPVYCEKCYLESVE